MKHCLITKFVFYDFLSERKSKDKFDIFYLMFLPLCISQLIRAK